jgi:hypothetical protein
MSALFAFTKKAKEFKFFSFEIFLMLKPRRFKQTTTDE